MPGWAVRGCEARRKRRRRENGSLIVLERHVHALRQAAVRVQAPVLVDLPDQRLVARFVPDAGFVAVVLLEDQWYQS
jgi:hypothetical protein